MELRATSPADDLLAVSRRVDWRFLLTPEFAAVGVSDGIDPALSAALRPFSSSVGVVSDFRAASQSDAARYALIVLADPQSDEIAAAARELEVDGWLYVEVSARHPRPVRRPRVIPAYVRALRRAGLEDVSGYWHFPDLASSEEIVPIGSLGALTFAFGRRRTARHVRGKTRLAGIVARAGLLGYVAAHGSVVGRRADTR